MLKNAKRVKFWCYFIAVYQIIAVSMSSNQSKAADMNIMAKSSHL